MRKLFSFLLALPLMLMISCTDAAKIEQLDWMLGTWEGIDDNELTFVEVWNKGTGNSMYGSGATITPDGDTLFKETLKIELVEGTPYYVATVPENPGPVLFKLVESDDNHCVFENLEHDFPQRISYRLETKNTLSVKLEGFENGLPKTEGLLFEKNTGVSLLPGKKDSVGLNWEIQIDSVLNADTIGSDTSTH
jgi:hypothetical protein